jgi:CRP/FNR family transcriptional regulator
MRLDPDTLRRASPFAKLAPDALRALTLCFRERRYGTNDVVFREGDPAAGLLFLADGELAASQRVNGAERGVGRIVAGQLFGETALIDPTPRVATVRAVRISIVFEIGDDSVGILKRAAPSAARALVAASTAAVARRLRRLEQRVERELERGMVIP